VTEAGDSAVVETTVDGDAMILMTVGFGVSNRTHRGGPPIETTSIPDREGMHPGQWVALEDTRPGRWVTHMLITVVEAVVEAMELLADTDRINMNTRGYQCYLILLPNLRTYCP